MSTVKRLALILALATVFTILAASMALAGGDRIPHGGYDTTTDACLQCHDIHEAGSDYVLLRWATVLDTCGSCHYLFLTDPDPSGGSFGQGTYETGTPLAGSVVAYDPGYSGDETATAGYDAGISNNLGARTSAYEVPSASRTTHAGHRLQMGQALGGAPYLFADGTTNLADYIPGGTSKLTAIERAAYPNTVNTLSYSGTNGLYCASCHTPHGNFGQELFLTGTTTTAKGKILSGKPNHTTPKLTISSWVNEGNEWCERCHDKRDSDPGSSHYNHPDSFCLTCHANATTDLSGDFPHTGQNENLLSKEPDALCIQCHKKGLLP